MTLVAKAMVNSKRTGPQMPAAHFPVLVKRPWLCRVALAAMAVAAADGQIPTSPTLSATQLPPLHRDILSALGTRLSKPGKEAYTLSATLDQYSSSGQKTSSSPATVLWQYPGLLRLQIGLTSQVLAYNGSTIAISAGGVVLMGNDLIETLTKDVGENFLLERYTGQTAQIIGRSVNVHDTRTANRLSGRCDLLRVTEVNGVRGPGSTTIKTFCFDPLTHLLRSVFYTAGSAVIETRFSNWQTINGDSYPAKIDRYSGVTPVLSLTINQIATSGPQASTLFNPQ